MHSMAGPLVYQHGCELIHFFAYLLATPQISQKVEKFMCNLLMTCCVYKAQMQKPSKNDQLSCDVTL